MKKIFLLFLFLGLSTIVWSQTSDGALTTLINSTIKTKPFSPATSAAALQAIVNSKTSRTEMVTTSGTDTYTVTANSTITSYITGLQLLVKFTNSNTGAATLNVNSLGAKSIKKTVSTTLSSGDIAAGQILWLSYDGTNFQTAGSVGGGGAWGTISTGTGITNQLDLQKRMFENPGSRTYINLKHDTSNHSVAINTITKLPNGSLLATATLSADGTETGSGTAYAMISTTQGETWGTPVKILNIVSNEIYNVSCQVFLNLTGNRLTMIYLKYYHSGLEAGLYQAHCTVGSELSLWTLDGLIYGAEGDNHYLDPGSDKGIRMNDSTLIYPFSQWTTVGEGGPNDRTSAVGYYHGLLLKSTNDGTSFTLITPSATLTDPVTHFATQFGVLQFEDTRRGYKGDLIMVARGRNGYVSMWKCAGGSSIDLTSWTFQTNTLVGPNEPNSVRYYPEYKTMVAITGYTIPAAPNPEQRTRLHIQTSYDKGITWNFNSVAMSAYPYYVSAVSQFLSGGRLIVNISKGNLSNGDFDGWSYDTPINSIIGFDAVTQLSAALATKLTINTTLQQLTSTQVQFADPATPNSPYTIFNNNGSITAGGTGSVWQLGSTIFGASQQSIFQLSPAANSGIINFINAGNVTEGSYLRAFRFQEKAGVNATNFLITNDQGGTGAYTGLYLGANSGVNLRGALEYFPSNYVAGSHYQNLLYISNYINNGRLIFRNNEAEVMTMYHGKLSVGTRYTAPADDPGAGIHIMASNGNATYGPFKIDEGTLVSSPEAGLFEPDVATHKLYYTNGSAVRLQAFLGYTATAILDFGSTAAGAKSDLTITVTGAADGDAVFIGVPNGSTVANGTFTAWVSAANTVTVRFSNDNLVTALDPTSGTFRATVVK